MGRKAGPARSESALEQYSSCLIVRIQIARPPHSSHGVQEFERDRPEEPVVPLSGAEHSSYGQCLGYTKYLLELSKKRMETRLSHVFLQKPQLDVRSSNIFKCG